MLSLLSDMIQSESTQRKWRMQHDYPVVVCYGLHWFAIENNHLWLRNTYQTCGFQRFYQFTGGYEKDRILANHCGFQGSGRRSQPNDESLIDHNHDWLWLATLSKVSSHMLNHKQCQKPSPSHHHFCRWHALPNFSWVVLMTLFEAHEICFVKSGQMRLEPGAPESSSPRLPPRPPRCKRAETSHLYGGTKNIYGAVRKSGISYSRREVIWPINMLNDIHNMLDNTHNIS